MIDRHHIPFIVFAACLCMALALGLFTGAWTAALAIALSGCALALAMRPPEYENHDTAFLEEDIAEIRATGEAQTADIAVLRSSIDEMAEIVEAIAGDVQRLSSASADDEIDSLRRLVDKMGERVRALDSVNSESATRLNSLERGMKNLQGSIPDASTLASHPPEPMPQSPAVSEAPNALRRRRVAPEEGLSVSERAERLRERKARLRAAHTVSAMPVFDADQTPRTTLVEDVSGVDSVEGTLAAVSHALDLIEASGDPNGRIFVRLPHAVTMRSEFADALEPVLTQRGEAFARLIVVVPQSVMQSGLPRVMAMMLGTGARFAMERMTDWSADLEALAKRGLAVILVDGPGMAKSAMSQKGDPTRLRQVLHARGVNLLAGEIETRMQLDAVRTLQPDLIAGPGLGEATVTEVSA